MDAPPLAFENPASANPSSRNALKHGLFAAHDFIRDGEHEEYAATFAALTRELSPEGVLETTFATEIMGATWRLRRCRLVESVLAESAPAGSIDDEAIAKQQKSVDRARAQTFTRLCRAISELRKIQTEHVIREQIHADVPGLTDSKQVVSAMRLQNRAKSEAEQAQQIPDPGHNPEAFDAFLARAGRPAPAPQVEREVSFCNQPAPPAEPEISFCADPEPAVEPEISFCKPAPIAAAQTSSKPKNTPRNAPCPCRSGHEDELARPYPHENSLQAEAAGQCCGKDAPPVLAMAA
jgi:hypothetical protein